MYEFTRINDTVSIMEIPGGYIYKIYNTNMIYVPASSGVLYGETTHGGVDLAAAETINMMRQIGRAHV